MDKKESTKLLLTLEIILGIITTTSFIIILGLSCYIMQRLETYPIPIMLILIDFALFVVGLHFCILIETRVGYYRCGKCGEIFIPDLQKTYPSMHFGRTRYMRCPKCNKKSWCKKTISNKRDV